MFSNFGIMGERELMENVNAIIPPGAIVGIIGPNGAGKTTLFKMLVGQEKPDTGTLKVGETVQFAYVDQGRESLTPGKTVYEIISDGAETIKLGGREVNARAYCTRFNFHGADQQKKVDVLSGGERNRVHLACMIDQPETARQMYRALPRAMPRQMYSAPRRRWRTA